MDTTTKLKKLDEYIEKLNEFYQIGWGGDNKELIVSKDSEGLEKIKKFARKLKLNYKTKKEYVIFYSKPKKSH